jgi:GxxExxY protein
MHTDNTEQIDHLNEITGRIIGTAYKVHSNLGPGLLESSYKECLYYELCKARMIVEKEKPLPLVYEDVKLDLLAERKVIVEIKAVETLNDVHLAQVLTYLKLTNCKIGLLINFNVADLKKGIKRVIR